MARPNLASALLGALITAAAAVAAPAVTGSTAAASAADGLTVATDLGRVQGAATAGVRAFKGIPYAVPPVGALRFEPPRPAKPWKGVLDASAYRSACPQVARFGVTDASEDEDCLYLNVTVPAAPPAGGRKRPVIVWVHGGAFVGGSSNLYPLEYYARTGDVAIVSINYRLGVFGFMAHPAFAPAHDGSLGLEDQREALRWVKRNIAAFGGDPANVTFAGESAGGASVCMQLIAPDQSRGLFQKAIIQSLACGVPLLSQADAGQAGLEVARRVHCDEAATAVACLRTKTVAELLEAQTAVAAANPRAFAPSVGSTSVPRQGAEAFATGKFLRVPMINGGNRDEMRLYVAYAIQAGQAVNAETYPKLLETLYGAHGPEVLKEYPASEFPAVPSALGTAESDYTPGGPLANCLYLEAGKDASRYVPVYEFEFTDRHAPPEMDDPGFEMGAVHAAELPYFFPHISHNSKVDGPDLEPASQPVSEAMVAYWSSFARTGTPAAPGLPAWPRFRNDGDVMRFEPGAIHPFDAAAEHHCRFWGKLYPQALGSAQGAR
ncbi:MAG TPA: carboxylesterase family protein [Steroidobacteraceae bacterium]|nr:carboxylesterase family protein [Steroidobacteraceae bacterium]